MLIKYLQAMLFTRNRCQEYRNNKYNFMKISISTDFESINMLIH